MSNGNPGSTTVTISLSTLPSFVALGIIKGTVKATTTQNVNHSNGTLFLLSGTQVMDQGFPEDRVYVTDQAPTELQNIPWVDLLEYSCLWAYCQSGAAGCRRALTEGRSNNGRAYLPASGPQLIERINGTLYRLDFTKALDFPTGHLDFQNVNGLLSVKMQSLGISAGNLLITHIDSNGDPWSGLIRLIPWDGH